MLEHLEQADFDKDGVDLISYELSLDVKSQSVDFKPIYSEYTKKDKECGCKNLCKPRHSNQSEVAQES